MNLTIGKKLSVGIGILLVLVVVVGALATWFVRTVHASLLEIVDVHEPVIEATLDVEANLAGLGAALYGYLKERDPQHLERVKSRRVDLGAALAALRELPLDDEVKKLLGDLKTQSDETTTLIDAVLAGFDEREKARASAVDLERQLDALVSERMQAPAASGVGVDGARLRAAMEIEIELTAATKALGNFAETAEVRYERDFESAVGGARAAVASYEGLVAESERAASREFSAAFDTLVADARTVIEKEKALRSDLRAFTKARRATQYGTLDALRKHVSAAYDGARGHAMETVEASRWALGFGVLAAVIIGLLSGIVVSRSVTRPVNDVVGRLASVSSEIVAATSEQTAGASEQASAVSQTVSNIEEMRQTSEQAASRAQQMMEQARESAASGEKGQTAVLDAVTAMRRVEQQATAVAGHIVALAERTQAIGEIIATVNEMAEQSNLLALNAAIEASRAGEQGRGFGVVATEIKALAERSKKATGQVRQILGDIQKATNAAVLSTEESSRGVNATIAVVNQAGDVLRELARTVEETAAIAAQSAASARQQATGVAQVQQAMAAIDQVARQSLVATRQVADSARELGTMSSVLRAMVDSRDGTAHVHG
jgi:methyl-accepting chemotaxis protein